MDAYLESIKQRYKEALAAREEYKKIPITKGCAEKDLYFSFAVIAWEERIAEYVVFGKKYDYEPQIPYSNYEEYM